ncbi:MAG: peptidyl-prolyl cis-trans isomerase [Atribacterota bacterium]|nr:peptidyl-prolyl cis-trans isomerase [Atribacterota bacterium]MDD4895979.1 peptidyl-prolyl cis-trans isomerase [Atribacterota bacterium]MDD5638196.1 peptidyl-prolyl cis-trans isomerase [Atribacterota bacterium]
MKIFYKKFSAYFIISIFSFLLIFSIGINSQEDNLVEVEATPEGILAIVNDEIITLNDFNQYWDAIPDQYKIQLNKEDLLEQIVIQTLLIQKTKEIKLSDNPEVAFQIKNATEQILIQYLIEKEVVETTELSDDDIKFYYEENKENYWKEEEVHALNILTETEDQALDALLKLNEGMDFSTLAQEISIATSASKGGDIGFISKGTLTAEIEEQLFILNPGDLSKIIPTEKGFHIFKIIEKNPSRYLELDEVREEIKYQLLPQKQQQAFDQYLKNIEDVATIEKNLELIKEE